MKLDKSKPYITVCGAGVIDGFTGVRFMQGGKYFGGDGTLARREGKEVAPAIAAPAAKSKKLSARAQKAADAKVKAEAEAEGNEAEGNEANAES